MKVTITLDIPEERLPELLRLAAPAAPDTDTDPPPRPRPHRPEPDRDDRDEPADIQRETPRRPGGGTDGPVRSGKQLLGWLRKQPRETFKRAVGLARSWGYGEILVDLADAEAAAIYRELTAKPEGRQKWGG